jgi:hypothetical protein
MLSTGLAWLAPPLPPPELPALSLLMTSSKLAISAAGTLRLRRLLTKLACSSVSSPLPGMFGGGDAGADELPVD